ncbi:MAG: ammonium transporter [Planctomycetota bacterium]|nr:ammonium transporter [Planctomycetota bacterium]
MVRADEEPAPTAESNAASIGSLLENANILWTCLAAFLVFFMQAGFALVEAGLTRAKNTCNILMKNLMDFAVGSIAFWAIGFGLMFGLTTSGWIGGSGFFFDAEPMAEATGKSIGFSWAFLIFQTVFAATAATIVSGAMAERTKFTSYLIYSAFISAFVYPIFGHWAWGNLFFADNATWLTKAGFIDYAGSTVVHSVGGWAALAGAIVLGPRIGKYGKDGKIKPIPGHSMTLVALGVFILWLGWFGFNPGSTTSVGDAMARIAVTTNLAGAAGAISALILSWILFKKPDTSMAFNGVLAGLVGITAGCFNMTPSGAVLVGLICGAAVVGAVLFFDKIRVDDPVGAISVHGVCGVLGTLMVGLWGVVYDPATGKLGDSIGLLNGGDSKQFIAQLMGVGAAFLLVFPLMLGFFSLLKATVGLRVSEQEEVEGLDLHEHGNEAYPKDGMVSVPNLGSAHAPGLAGAPSMGQLATDHGTP